MSKYSDFFLPLLAILGLWLGGFIMGFGLGSASTLDRERAEAIRAGAATYAADPETGATKFTYIRR